MTLGDAWETHAQDWIAWARSPDHDGFWGATWPELCAVLPQPDGLVIEIGCGEGRVGRALLGRGMPSSESNSQRHSSTPPDTRHLR